MRLLKESVPPAAEIAREPGLLCNRLFNWAAQLDFAGAALPGSEHFVAAEDEVVRLCRENAWLTEEREIFKKAATYFAKRLP